MREQLKQLRQAMAVQGLSMYIVRDVDDHASEYVASCYKQMEYVSGFSGGDGTLLATADKGYLWTDGRYFIQAANELKGSGVELMRMAQPGVPTIYEFIAKHLLPGQKLGACADYMSAGEGRRLRQLCHDLQAEFVATDDLVGAFWQSRPAAPAGKVFLLEDKYAGQSVKAKLTRLRKAMAANGAQALLLGSLDDIAWLCNFRGDDIPYWPVCLAYALVTADGCQLFFDLAKAGEHDVASLAKKGITAQPYDQVATACRHLPAGTVIQFDSRRINCRLLKALGRHRLIDAVDPTVIMKSVKNDVEIANLKLANIYDGAAVTKLMYWLKHDTGAKTELSVTDRLLQLRRQQPYYIEDSFSTITAFGPNGAMMHYNPAHGDNAAIGQGLLLIDSGGQYYLGTTDITRTFVMGSVTPEMKADFTRVLKAHLDLSMARFLEGIHGYNLDILAREPMWAVGLDYKCGTGHGVGYLSNVHEGPQGFRYNIVPERSDNAAFEVNMVTTIEPGIYKEGRYGIRHENDVVCVDAGTTADGHFLAFEPLTLCPFDRDGIDASQLSADEVDYLDKYHQRVYDRLSPLMDEDEKEWLKQATRPLI